MTWSIFIYEINVKPLNTRNIAEILWFYEWKIKLINEKIWLICLRHLIYIFIKTKKAIGIHIVLYNRGYNQVGFRRRFAVNILLLVKPAGLWAPMWGIRLIDDQWSLTTLGMIYHSENIYVYMIRLLPSYNPVMYKSDHRTQDAVRLANGLQYQLIFVGKTVFSLGIIKIIHSYIL